MEVNLKIREKKKISELIPGQTFRTIERIACYEIIDFSGCNMFDCKTKEVKVRGDVVYCVELSTGIVSIFPKTIEVYVVNIKAEEY
jgi:hypothetical protein